MLLPFFLFNVAFAIPILGAMDKLLRAFVFLHATVSKKCHGSLSRLRSYRYRSVPLSSLSSMRLNPLSDFLRTMGFAWQQLFTLAGFEEVYCRSNFRFVFHEQFVVTLICVGLVVAGCMAWALTDISFGGILLSPSYSPLGIIDSIRLAQWYSEFDVRTEPCHTLTALVLVYIAQGLPLRGCYIFV